MFGSSFEHLMALLNNSFQNDNDSTLVHYSFNPSTAEANFVQSTRTGTSLKTIKPYHVDIRWIALSEYHVPGFQSFFKIFASFRICQISQQQHDG